MGIHMKKFISFLLMSSIIGSTSGLVYAENNTIINEEIPYSSNLNFQIQEDDYEIQEFSFKSLDQIIDEYYRVECARNQSLFNDSNEWSLELNEHLMEEKEYNISLIKEFVEDQNFEVQGFIRVQESLEESLDNLLNSDTYFENYKLYTPKAAGDDNMIGSYNGYYFKGIFSVYHSASYQYDSTDNSKIKSWLEMGTNLFLTLGHVAAKFVVPYTVVSALISTYGVKQYTRPWLVVTLKEEVTERIVCIQDKNMYLTSNPTTYVAVIKDMGKIFNNQFVLNDPSPYINAVSTLGPRQTLGTTNFFNPQATMIEGLHNYLANRGTQINTHIVPKISGISFN